MRTSNPHPRLEFRSYLFPSAAPPRPTDVIGSEWTMSHARVLEIPTPTWQDYDEVRFGITMTPEGIPRSHQERAYTSPIWYTPR